MDDPAQLDLDQAVQFYGVVSRMVFAWEGLYTLYHQNSLSEERFECEKADIQTVLGSPGGRLFWADIRVGWAKSFRDQVDEWLETEVVSSFNPTSWSRDIGA